MSYLPNDSSKGTSHFAFVELKIGDFNATPIPPEYLQQFSYERLTTNGLGNKILFTLTDATALAIEYEMTKGNQDIEFRYGYVDGPTSKTYCGYITSYDIDFDVNGATLSFEAMSKGVVDSSSHTRSATYKNMLISDIVRQIAKEEGWYIAPNSIDETKPVYEEQVYGSHKKVLKTYYRANMTSLQFINQVLAKEAVSVKNNMGGYSVWLSDELVNDNTEMSTIHFKSSAYTTKQISDDTDDSDNNIFGVNIPKRYRFEFGHGINSTVKSFNPDFNAIISAMLGSGTIDADTISAYKNELIKVQYDKSSNPNREVTGDYDINTQFIHNRLKTSSYSYSELQNMSAAMWDLMKSQSYNADMVIVGDPTLDVQVPCSVIMITSSGLPHHSSGIYSINSIVDDITSGTFESKLSLMRNCSTAGNDTSVGLNITTTVTYNGTNNADDTGTTVTPSSTSSEAVALSGKQSSDLLSVASSQVGTVEGKGNDTKYGKWYGLNYNPWCAMFVSWCANQSNIPESVIPKFASCNVGMQWFKDKGEFKDRSSVPTPGCIIFFGSESNAHHVGIVESCDNGIVNTIEGNTSDCCARRHYSVGSTKIAGYGVPNYSN